MPSSLAACSAPEGMHTHLPALQVAWRHADQIQSTQTWELVKDFHIELDPIAQRLLAGDSYQGVPEVLEDVEDACATAAQHYSDVQVGQTMLYQASALVSTVMPAVHSVSQVGHATHDVTCSCDASVTCPVLGM